MALAGERRRRGAPGNEAARALAEWAIALRPRDEDLALADRALRDTLAVTAAAAEHELRPLFDRHLGEAGRRAALAHVNDFDDLHMPSTAHLSAICVAAALATNGGAKAYLAGAGVMARVGTALGWPHYSAGWHATCTAGAPAAAVTGAVALGMDPEQVGRAIALAIPAAGGVQRAFGTASKSLQVGFAADAGVRAAKLAADGATADPQALEQWMTLVNGDPSKLDTADATAVPGGLAIKLFPCCYALQRPISALKQLPHLPEPDEIERIRVYTPASSLQPLIRSRPATGLEAKFSLQYALAAFLTDGRADFKTFEDEAVQRDEVQRLIERVETHATDTGEGLLAGEVTIEIDLAEGETISTTLADPPGAPSRPPTDDELNEKLTMCGADEIAELTWELTERVDPG